MLYVILEAKGLKLTYMINIHTMRHFNYLFIIISIILSWCIAMSADLGRLELGAMINLVYPILIGLLLLGFYAIITLFSRAEKVRFMVSIIIVFLNLATGIYIRFVDF